MCGSGRLRRSGLDRRTPAAEDAPRDDGTPESGLRSRGLGTALLAAAEEVTRRRGGELLEINVDGDDADARRFYERHGYRNSEPGNDEQLLYYFRELTG